MKKISVCVLALLLGFTLISCQSTQTFSNSNINERDEYECKLNYDNPIEVDELFIEDVENAYSFEIYRRNISKNEEFNFDIIYIQPIGYSYKYYKDKVITDYFVNPMDTYQYIIRYKTQDNKIVLESNICITQKEGCGEIEYGVMPKASYDKESGEFTFTRFPEFTNSIEKVIKDENLHIFSSLSYSCYENGNSEFIPIYIEKHSQTIDLTSLIKNDVLYNKEFHLSSLYSQIEDENLIFYVSPLNKEQLLDIPTVITVPNLTLTLKGEATKSCIILTLPPPPKGATRYTVSRRDLDKTPLENRGEQENLYTSSHDLSKNVIKDYFVEKGKNYEYVVSFRRDEEDFGGILVKNTAPLRIKAVGGAGDLIPNEKPKASFDEETGILSFSRPYTLNKGITKFIHDNNGKLVYSRIYYINYEENKYIIIPVSDSTDTKFDIKQLVGEEGLDTNYQKDVFYINVSIDGFSFSKSLWAQCMEDMPENIYVSK